MKDNTERINELAFRLKDGEKTVFDELYSLTCSKAYFIALQINGDEHEAEDIVQDSYITALSKISTLEKTESFMSWFNRIVANKSKDYLKKRKPRVFNDDEEKAFSVIADENTEFSPDASVDRDELRTAVMEAIKELGAEKRVCVLMKYFEDMSVNDIAESIDVPVTTVKNRLWVARHELKNLFERKGITAAYSVAPFSAVTWALNSSFEVFSQGFDTSASAAKILSGIAVASAAGTAAATATTAATGGGIAAKIAAASTMQKIVSGLVVAGVVTGSTIGITSVVKDKNKPEDIIPTTSYAETADYNINITDEPENTPAVNILDPAAEENGEEYESKVINFKNQGKMPEKVDFKGNLKLGNNHVDFDDGADTYYVNFTAEKAGYYLFICDRKDIQSFAWIFVPENSENGEIKDFYRAQLNSDNNGQLYYLDPGEHTLLVSRTPDIVSSDISVEYFGEEITDFHIEQEDLDNVILGYNEVRRIDNERLLFTAHDMTELEEGRYGNCFRTKIFFSSGKVYDMGKTGLGYRVKDGKLKEGKNTVTFMFADFLGFDKEFEITAHYPTDYVKDIKVSNLDEFKTVKINEEGFVYEKPENFDVTVTFADGTKETFDGVTWDRFIKLDNGKELFVTFCRAREDGSMDYRLRGREALHFRVSIGETDYIDEICTVNEFDVIGYRKRLDENNLEEARKYTSQIKNGIELMKENTESPEDFIWYSAELSEITAYNSYKIIKRIAGFELDYAITTFRILTENEFDLINN